MLPDGAMKPAGICLPFDWEVDWSVHLIGTNIENPVNHLDILKIGEQS